MVDARSGEGSSRPLSWPDVVEFSVTGRGGHLLLEMVLSLSLAVYFLTAWQAAYTVCPMTELVFAGTFYWVYLNRYDQSVTSLNWVWVDVFRCSGAVVIYLVISISRGASGNLTGLVLALLAMLVFTHNVYILMSPCPSSSDALRHDDSPAYSP